MPNNDYGQLVPQGGGDSIPLRKPNLLVGRRESCDIVLRFSNVSAHHCQLENHGGYWYVRDMNSRNGTRVNGVRVTEKRLDPGDELRVAKHKYEVSYSPIDLGAIGPPPSEQLPVDVMGKSLLERAGLDRRGITGDGGGSHRRMDVLDEETQKGLFKKNDPI